MKKASLMVLAAALVCGLSATSAEMTAREKALKAAGLSPSAPPAAPAKNAAAPAGATVSGNLVTVDFPTSGMMCNNCVASVESTFKGVEGVTAAKPMWPGDKTVVTYDRTKTDLDKILATFMEKKAQRFDAAKPGEIPKSMQFTYNGQPETLKGGLAVKAKDAPGDVVCRIVARRNGERNERAINVITTDAALRTQIETLRQKGEEPSLTGVMSEKGLELTKIN
jgi:copper chaperone CopZ